VLDSADGQRLMQYLKNITMHRILPGETSDGMLRHREGQRWTVAVMDAWTQMAKETQRGTREPLVGPILPDDLSDTGR